MDYEEHQKYKEDQKKRWMDHNAPKSRLLASQIMSMSPDIGYYINVEGFQISQNIFKEEYKQITDAYYSVIKKLQEHHNTMTK
jgi:hypothetical protein